MIENLIILSAELIDNDLQTFFGRIPSCMIPLNGRPAIDYIYHENYNHYKKIFLLVGKENQYIKKHIDDTQLNIELLVLKNSSNLLESLKYSLENINSKGETTVIFGDTYVPYMCSIIEGKNSIVYSKSYESIRWTIGTVSNKKISFFDKKELSSSIKHNIVIGIFNFLYPKKLYEIIEGSLSETATFYTILEQYFNFFTFEFLNTSNWVDYGHVDNYFEEKKTIESRDFNEIETNVKAKTVTKKSSYISKFVNEISWFIELPDSLKLLTPRIIDYSINMTSPFLKMEYYNYLTLHEMFVFGNISIGKWKQILNQLKNINSQFGKYSLELDIHKKSQALKAMYLEKTIERLQRFDQQSSIDFSKPIVINNQKYDSINYHISQLEIVLKREGIFDNRNFQLIHGDLCLSNILFDPVKMDFKLIDPRGTFGEIKLYGDNLYELAKLAHSIDGLYDFIISDKFNLIQNNNIISYKIHSHNIQRQINDYFYSEIVLNIDKDKIKLIQSLLFFSMLPLHSDHKNRQYIMLCRALELIKPYININDTI